MSTRKVVLFDTQYAPSTETTKYTTPANIVATIDKLVARNTDTVARTVTVLLVPPDGTPTGTEFIVEAKTLQPGQSWLFPAVVGNMLVEDGTIRLYADAPNVVVIRGSGREDTTDV